MNGAEGRREVGSNRIGQERVKRQTRSDRWVAWGGGPGFAVSKCKKGKGAVASEAKQVRTDARQMQVGQLGRKRQHQERNKRTEGAMMGREESSEVGIVLIFFLGLARSLRKKGSC